MWDLGDLGPDVTLADLGLDSLMGVEVSQKLERDYDVALTMKDIRQLTFSGLRDIGQSLQVDGEGERKKDSGRLPGSEERLIPIDFDLNKLVPAEAIVRMNDVNIGTPVFFIHPLEGTWFNLSFNLYIIWPSQTCTR